MARRRSRPYRPGGPKKKKRATTRTDAPRQARADAIEVHGTVTEPLPNAMVRVELDNGHLLPAHTPGQIRRPSLRTRRGAKGVINIKVTERNGRVVAIEAVHDDDELMMITQNGMMLRTDLTAVREIGRATQGVRLLRLEQGDRVVAVARIAPEKEGEDPAESEDQPPAPPEGDEGQRD